jgi:dTMP kinase
MAGRLIVFEGTDGSGKSTQFRLACDALAARGQDFRTCVYPQYQEDSSALVRMYLRGEFGSRPGDVNAYAAAAFFAVDRYAGYKKHWADYYAAGGLVVLARFTTSNAVHQASKLPEDQREDFFRWLADFEYGRLGLPAPDLVLWLDLPIPLAAANLRRRESDTHTTADIHEVDQDYLSACRQTAAQAARFYGWQRIDCADGRGGVRSMEDIHREIMTFLT